MRRRLEQYNAGTLLDYERLVDPDAFTRALLTELDRPVDYRPVETHGAARSAQLLAALL